MASQAPVTALILTKNEASMIKACIDTLKWCKEVIVIDDRSTDTTVSIAKAAGAQIEQIIEDSFAKKRAAALKFAQQPWVFYIDADERVTPELAREIMVHIETDSAAVMTIQRKNIMFGVEFRHGGWQNDPVTRVFKRTNLQGWQGDIHESPVFDGEEIKLNHPLLHLTHRSTRDGLYKSAEWTPIEAKLLFESGIPRVGFFTLIRKGVMEFIRRVVFKKGYKDGQAGVMEGVIQAINRVLVYIQVWELQQSPSLPDRYNQLEDRINQQWQVFHSVNNEKSK